MDNKDLVTGIVAKLTQLTALYFFYAFTAGWAFYNFYYRSFGVSNRWFDFPLPDTLMKGVVVLVTRAGLLMLGIIVVSVLVEVSSSVRASMPIMILAWTFLTIGLFQVYIDAASAGEYQYRVDAGDESTLPYITLSAREKEDSKSTLIRDRTLYSGRLLIFRNGFYYIFVKPEEENNTDACSDKSSVPCSNKLRVISAEKAGDVEIVP